jgi:hypothetical protein
MLHSLPETYSLPGRKPGYSRSIQTEFLEKCTILRKEQSPPPLEAAASANSVPTAWNEPLQTPITSNNLTHLCRLIEENIGALKGSCKLHLQKLDNAVETAFTERDLLFDDIWLLSA